MANKQPRKRKPIGGLIKKVQTYRGQEKVLLDWAESWKNDQEHIIRNLRSAIHDIDLVEIERMTHQLEVITEKRFTALSNICTIVSDPNRQLKNSTYDPITGTVTVLETSNEESVKASPVKSRVEEQQEIISEIVASYNSNLTLKEISELTGYSVSKIIKILVTAGVYTSKTYDDIKFLREHGMTDDEIADKLNLGTGAMNNYTPYQKGIYNLENPSENAQTLREYRKKQGVD